MRPLFLSPKGDFFIRVWLYNLYFFCAYLCSAFNLLVFCILNIRAFYFKHILFLNKKQLERTGEDLFNETFTFLPQCQKWEKSEHTIFQCFVWNYSAYFFIFNPLVPRVAYLLHDWLLRGTNSKINVCSVFFPSVECLLHCKVIIRYRNIVIITFCGYLLFSRKCQPPWNMSGPKNITDGENKINDHSDNNRFRICFFR
jgi:hypothetical protein